MDRKTAFQLLSEGCGKQLAPNIAQSVHDFRPRGSKGNDCALVNFEDFGLEAATLNGLPTKLDQLSSDGIGKDSGYGGSRLLRGTEMIGATDSSPSYHQGSSSLFEFAGRPLATNNGSELAHHLGLPRASHPNEFKPQAMQLWDHQFMKEGELSQLRSYKDNGTNVRNLTKADCSDAQQQLNKFQSDPMALKVGMEMKSKTDPVVPHVTTMTSSSKATMTSSSKALPINYELFADMDLDLDLWTCRAVVGDLDLHLDLDLDLDLV